MMSSTSRGYLVYKIAYSPYTLGRTGVMRLHESATLPHMATSTSTVQAAYAGAVHAAENSQDSSNIIVVVTPRKDYYITRNCIENVEQHLPWSVEETWKFASAELVAPKISHIYRTTSLAIIRGSNL